MDRRHVGAGVSWKRVVIAVASTIVVLGAVGCTPASGLPDSVEYQWGSGCRVEIRHGVESGGVFVAARYIGLDPQLLSYQDRCIISAVSVTAEAQPPVQCDVDEGWTGTGCSTSQAPIVGGTWYQASSPGSTFESGVVVVRNPITDVPHQFEIGT